MSSRTHRVVRRFRSLPIRSRLALLVAAAVAFAVAAVSVTCWFIVQGKLYDEIDNDLRSSVGPLRPDDFQDLTNDCRQTPSDELGMGSRPKSYGQLVRVDGKVCLFPSSTAQVQVSGDDKAVAKDPDPNQGHIRDGTDNDGNKLRVLTTAVVIKDGRLPLGVAADYSLVIALPLKGTQSTLNELALILLLVSGVGVLGAGAAGLAVARAGLRPVDKLTEAVEHVARTEDLNVRIPVEDDSEDEIARLSHSFNSMTSALASSRDLQQQLIADAGHELRTPLTSLRTNIELLTRSEETGRPIPEADRKALLASVKAQMTELATLIGDLQELSRPDPGQHSERTQIVAWQDTVESALRRARLRGPELTITADVEPWFVRAEPSALERAVVNILDNAVKFSPEGGLIEVRLTEGVLTVRDHGPGIPADELPYVFDRFWRSPGARALPGSGLGLSIVARTVQQAGGEVSLSRAEGGGTVATVRLPGAAVPPPEDLPSA
ncbi:HAMP domain-containing sensor histidine kinase [Streptomyces violaceochromogenes]|uniref:histidine kinase n=1 Tax=Streptomyces violaceochromogenes TaxID=67377 RepID=A0ABU6LZT4_9ACTN|nr:HAMP domain-containing sensor histidine kinase [Streptomyces violaceochromogenes]MEC7054929.1 HAMP domain-containing sensor histidine kinase [Streptomyces violaceochromogenes]GHC75791.1 two-component sensor histidine kinase [Streptomyces violaceochromogenes]